LILFIFANGLCILYLAGLKVIGTIEKFPHYTWWVASALFSLDCLCFIFLDATCISHLDNDLQVCVHQTPTCRSCFSL
jgi:hypothetical protein